MKKFENESGHDIHIKDIHTEKTPHVQGHISIKEHEQAFYHDIVPMMADHLITYCARFALFGGLVLLGAWAAFTYLKSAESEERHG